MCEREKPERNIYMHTILQPLVVRLSEHNILTSDRRSIQFSKICTYLNFSRARTHNNYQRQATHHVSKCKGFIFFLFVLSIGNNTNTLVECFNHSGYIGYNARWHLKHLRWRWHDCLLIISCE